MAAIVRNYTLFDLAILNTAGLNSDVYSPVAARGIYSEPNGQLDAANLDATFQVEAQHIIQGEAARAYGAGSKTTLDFVNQAFGTDDNSDNFKPIPGLAVRFKMPYDCTAVLFTWEFFFSVWRHYEGTYAAQTAAPIIQTKAFINGVALAHTLAGCPETVFGIGPAQAGVKKEHLNAACRSGSHLASNLAAGWHELSIRLYMGDQHMAEDFEVISLPDPLDASVETSHRFTCGFRNVSAVPLL